MGDTLLIILYSHVLHSSYTPHFKVLYSLQGIKNASKVSCYVTCCVPLSPAPPSTHLWYAEQSQQIGHLYRRHRRGSAHHPRNDLSHLRLVAMVLGVVNVADGACNKERKGKNKKEISVKCQATLIYYNILFVSLI